MSKVEAYICDYCQTIRPADECVGVSQQVDLFDMLKSYPTIPDPAKALIHYCTNCYSLHVTSAAEREVNRKRDERAYEMKVKEFAYLVKSQCIERFNKKVLKNIQKLK